MKKTFLIGLLFSMAASLFAAQTYSGPFKSDGSNLPPGAITQNYYLVSTFNRGVKGVTANFSSTVTANRFEGGSLVIDNLLIDGNTLSSTSGAINLTPLSGQSLNLTLSTTGDFVVNTDQLYVDTSSGFVGIATSAPVSLLHVGPGGMGTIVYRTSGTAFRPQIFHSTTSAVSMIGTGVNDGTNNRRVGLFTNDTDSTVGIGIGYSSGAPAFVIMNYATEQFRITSAGLVGIGATSPANRLSVTGNASVGGDYTTTAAPTNGMIVQGRVGIGTTAPNSSAILDVNSTTLGFRVPVMTTTQKNAISSPAAGLVVYDSTIGKLCIYTTTWESVTSL